MLCAFEEVYVLREAMLRLIWYEHTHIYIFWYIQ
jgi:hypothetical protein